MGKIKLEIFRTKKERHLEAKKIIENLNKLDLTIQSPPVKNLFQLLQKYIQDGERIEVNIPFEEQNRTIKGVLETNIKNQVWVKLEYHEYDVEE
jgi:hypothetical protein